MARESTFSGIDPSMAIRRSGFGFPPEGCVSRCMRPYRPFLLWVGSGPLKRRRLRPDVPEKDVVQFVAGIADGFVPDRDDVTDAPIGVKSNFASEALFKQSWVLACLALAHRNQRGVRKAECRRRARPDELGPHRVALNEKARLAGSLTAGTVAPRSSEGHGGRRDTYARKGVGKYRTYSSALRHGTRDLPYGVRPADTPHAGL